MSLVKPRLRYPLKLDNSSITRRIGLRSFALTLFAMLAAACSDADTTAPEENALSAMVVPSAVSGAFSTGHDPATVCDVTAAYGTESAFGQTPTALEGALQGSAGCGWEIWSTAVSVAGCGGSFSAMMTLLAAPEPVTTAAAIASAGFVQASCITAAASIGKLMQCLGLDGADASTSEYIDEYNAVVEEFNQAIRDHHIPVRPLEPFRHPGSPV